MTLALAMTPLAATAGNLWVDTPPSEWPLAVDIPVVFHLVEQANGQSGATEDQVWEQMEVLNRAYASTLFSFSLLEIRRHQDDEFVRLCHRKRVEREFKRRHAVDPRHTLNIYTCRPANGDLGHAWFPHDYDEASSMHGVVVMFATLPGGRTKRFNLGHTAVHEVGHYFGLFHTFERGCDGMGDRVSDTPAERRAARGCPVGRNTCGDSGLDPVRNFMNFSDDACTDHFTSGQAERMLEQVASHRPGLLGR